VPRQRGVGSELRLSALAAPAKGQVGSSQPGSMVNWRVWTSRCGPAVLRGLEHRVHVRAPFYPPRRTRSSWLISSAAPGADSTAPLAAWVRQYRFGVGAAQRRHPSARRLSMSGSHLRHFASVCVVASSAATSAGSDERRCGPRRRGQSGHEPDEAVLAWVRAQQGLPAVSMQRVDRQHEWRLTDPASKGLGLPMSTSR
jgi:hypothetical protein